MPPPIWNLMPRNQPAVAGGTVIFNLPLGLSFHDFLFRYQATGADASQAVMKADLTAVRLILNGETKWDVDATFLLEIMQDFYNRDQVAGAMHLPLARPWHKTIIGSDELAWPTGKGSGVQTLTVEVEIDAAAVNPDLELYALQGPQKTPENPQGVLGRHLAVRKFPKAAAAVGVNEVADLPRNKYGLIAAHFDTANIDDVTVEINSRKVFEADRVVMDAAYNEARTVQATWTHVDWCHRNRLADAVPMDVEDFRFKLNFSAAGGYNVYLERIENSLLGQ